MSLTELVQPFCFRRKKSFPFYWLSQLKNRLQINAPGKDGSFPRTCILKQIWCHSIVGHMTSLPQNIIDIL